MTNTAFADELKAARARRGMTQQQLADTLGVAEKTVRLYESGTTAPTVGTLKGIAKALDVSPNELLGWG